MASKPRMMETSKKRVLLVDDHAIFREGLSLILGQERDLAVCGSCPDAAAALKEAPSLKPDLAIIDISLEGMSGVELTKQLRARFPALRILVLSMHKEFIYAERVLRVGANGYITKQRSRQELLTAVRQVLRGETYVSDEAKEMLLRKIASRPQTEKASLVDHLSDREFEIFQLIPRGYGTRQIAEQLALSMKTVETHREHIREKLNLRTSFELMQYALEWAATFRAPGLADKNS